MVSRAAMLTSVVSFMVIWRGVEGGDGREGTAVMGAKGAQEAVRSRTRCVIGGVKCLSLRLRVSMATPRAALLCRFLALCYMRGWHATARSSRRAHWQTIRRRSSMTFNCLCSSGQTCLLRKCLRLNGGCLELDCCTFKRSTSASS